MEWKIGVDGASGRWPGREQTRVDSEEGHAAGKGTGVLQPPQPSLFKDRTQILQGIAPKWASLGERS